VYLNELVIDEIRNNTSAIFQNLLSDVVKRTSSSCGKIPLKPFQSVGGLNIDKKPRNLSGPGESLAHSDSWIPSNIS
jgi:hypothetical protein